MRDLMVELKQLRLHGMALAWSDLLEQGTHAGLDSSRWLLEHLLQAELTDRMMRSVSHQMHAAKFPVHRDLAGFDFTVSPVDRKLILQLAELAFTEPAHNAVLVGGPGTGKTHLATAMACPASPDTASGSASTPRSIWSTRWSRRRRTAGPDASRRVCCGWT
jgi:DNA replication protein DnaC